MRIAVLFLLIVSCSPLLADAAKPNFVDDVLPVLKQSCVACHSDDKQRGGLNLASFASAMQGGSSGVVVTAGQPDKSRLFTLANHTEEPKMPPKSDKLAAAKLDTIRKWIEQGARENSGSAAVVMAKPAAVALNTAVKGRPPGPPPMPGKLPLEPAQAVRRPAAVIAMAANPWAPVVALGGTKQISLYNTDSLELLGVLPFPPGQVHSLKFSRNGKMLLAAGGHGGQSGRAILFDLSTSKSVIEVGQETDAILCADLSADQSRIAVGSPSKVVRVYSTADGSVLREIKKHTDWVTAIEFSPDGVLLASGDRAGGIYVWEAQSGNEFFTLKGPAAMINDLGWRDDANLLGVASEDGTLRLFEMENGQQTKSWGGHPGGAASVQFAHDGKIASTGRNKQAKLWNPDGGEVQTYATLPEQGLRVAITHDGGRVIAGDWAGNVHVWSTKDQKQVGTLVADPLPAAERRKQAEKQVAEAEAKAKQATDAAVAAKANADKASAEISGFQKAVETATAASKAAQDALAAAKAEAAKLAAALATAQQIEAAGAVAHQALAEAAGKVQEAAKKQPENQALKTQAGKIAELAKSALGEVDAAKTTTAAATTAHAAAVAKTAAAEKTAAAAMAVIPVAQKKVTEEQAARKPVFDALAAAQARQTTATAELDAARKLLERERANAPK